MKIEQAIRIITNCAVTYQENLLDHNLLFVFGTQSNTNYFEAVFSDVNFLHLTGVVMKEKNLSRSQFFDRCIRGTISPDDISISNIGTTEMKLSVLPQVMQIEKTAKMIGDYDGSKTLLYTEKMAGGVWGCLGFVKDKTTKYYVPNTVLREDIRDITNHPRKRVLAVYRKPVSQPLYNELCYKAKGIEFPLIAPKSLSDLISE